MEEGIVGLVGVDLDGGPVGLLLVGPGVGEQAHHPQMQKAGPPRLADVGRGLGRRLEG